MNAIFLSTVLPKQPPFQENRPSIKIISKQIDHRIDGILLAPSKFGQHRRKNKPGDLS